MLRKGPSQKNWHDYVESRLSAFIDGELPEEERVQVRRHLSECAECQASLDSLGWTIKLLKQIPAPPLPRQFTLPVPAAPARAPSSSSWLRWSLAGVSALTVLLFAFLLSKDLLFSPAAPNRVALAPAAAPAPAQPSTVTASKAQPSEGSADNSFGIQAAPTSAPAATAAALGAAAPTTMPAAIQPPDVSGSAPQATPATRPSRSMTQPTPTPPCDACGAAPATAPGSRSAGTPTSAPMLGIMGLGGGPALPTSVATGITDAAALNVYAAPQASGPRLGWLPENTRLPVVGRDVTGRWLEIIFQSYSGSEQLGWVDSQFVLLSMPIDELPQLSDQGIPVPTPTPFGLGVPGDVPGPAVAATNPKTTAAP